ncbi:AB hydrolase-1 domain-containing protein [Mycena chlorophos]|uniref:AB hydrolase-1 domain-containing protein n=1 Tax=Mycena chlorophos TaxID=658473 RepID=A0A8H6VTW3_MYCCL|nr:AB hydrolase-1 domain-containing protein [Mycena chlorophos]
MPTFKLTNSLKFFYLDSGTTGLQPMYTTLFALHGGSFFSGTFKRLLAAAPNHEFRIIAINRRGYPGSTPYSPAEAERILTGGEDARAAYLSETGRDLALLLDGLITELSIPSHVMLLGWSLGNVSLLALVDTIRGSSLPGGTKERLRQRVKDVVLFQANIDALGIEYPPGLISPPLDPSIPPEDLGKVWAAWGSSHFLHGDLSTHSIDQLTSSRTNPNKRPTIDSGELKLDEHFVGVEEIAVDISILQPKWMTALDAMVQRVLFREPSGERYWVIYGTAETWTPIYAAWELEKRLANAKNAAEVRFKAMEGANHMVVWEDPDSVLRELRACAEYTY